MLAPPEWIQALWRPENEASGPRRILVAGCGTGAEAFAVRRRFPEAEIVAIDFSSRSIDIAREHQRRSSRRRPVEFLVRDIVARRLAQQLGEPFDFVVCHGVLTYFPDPTRALRNLRRCLTTDGALYLGVNGSRHPSIALRRALPLFGFDITRFADSPDLGDVLRLCDTFVHPSERMARMSIPYLASDVFGAHFENGPLAVWTDAARRAGVHFQGTASSHRALRIAAGNGLCSVLVPRTRVEVAQLIDILQPAGFHRLLFTRQPAVDPPWAGLHRLLTWRPILTRLFRSRLSAFRPPPPLAPPRSVTFTSPAMNARVCCDLPAWMVRLLRGADGRQSIASILGPSNDIPSDALVQHLYVLYQLMVVNLLPPLR
jgi:SAM-dependent methyltransferase